MAIGGIAVGVLGEPRLTRDIDMKVLVHLEDRTCPLAVFWAFTSLDDNPDDSFRRLGLAFFHDSNGIRIDVMLADTVFDETAIERARVVTLFRGKTIRVCTAEDLVVYKMLSTRIKDRADAVRLSFKSRARRWTMLTSRGGLLNSKKLWQTVRW
jgi:hypothetical protein